MQNTAQNQSGTTDRRSRLPLTGRLLLIFWGVSVPALAGWATYIAHTTLTPAKAHAPVKLATATPPPPRAPVVQPTSPHAPIPVPPAPKQTIATALPAPVAVVPKPLVTSLPPDKPVLAIVIEGIGYSDTLTRDALGRLPSPIAVGMSPYLSDLHDRIRTATDQHREVFITLPMQSAHPEHVDEGPHALGYGNSQDQDRQQLAWCLERASGATGLTDVDENGDDQSDVGYATTPDFTPIASIIAEHGLLYLAGSPDDGRQSRGMTATRWIDGDTDARGFDRQLAAITPTKDNPAPRELLMVGPLTPVAIARLATWLEGPGRAFTLVAPSALADSGQSSDKQADTFRKAGPASL